MPMEPILPTRKVLNAQGKQQVVDAFIGGQQDIADIAAHFGVPRRAVEQVLRECITQLVRLVPKPEDHPVILTEAQ